MKRAITTGLTILLGLAFGQGNVLDDFEASQTAWKAGLAPTYSDSSAKEIKLSTENLTQGKQSLELSFDKNGQPKAIFFLEKNFSLSEVKALSVDVFNPETASGIALSLSTGNSWEWHETDVIPLKLGAQTVSYDLTSKKWKAARSSWELNTGVTNLGEVKRIALLVFPSKSGSVFVDNLRTADEPLTLTVSQPQTETPKAQAVQPNSSAKPFTSLALKPLNSSLSQYKQAEFVLETDGVVQNPFDPVQADLKVRFTSPSGKTMTVPAFWYQGFDPKSLQPTGEPGWRVRFIPIEAGSWKAQAELANPVLKSEEMGLEVSPQKAKGFIRVNKQNPRYFAFDNGDFYLPIGLNLGWSTGNILADYGRWLDGLSKNGGNIARVWMASWSFGLEWSDTGLGNYSARLKQAWLLDQVFKMAEERGVYILLCLLNHGAFSATVNPEWNSNPYNKKLGGMLETPQEFVTNSAAKDLFKRRLRYIAARYAANTSLFAWEWWNEVNWTPISDADLAAWITEMTPVLKSFDPYNHLISNSTASIGTERIWKLPGIDFAQQHDYTDRDLILQYTATLGQISEIVPNKPLFPAEQGYSAGGTDSDLPINRDLFHIHNGLWAPVFLGYAGGGMYWWWDNLIDPKNLWGSYKGISTFMKGENLALLKPAKPAVNKPLDAVALSLQAKDRALVWIRSNSFQAAQATKLFQQALLDNTYKPGWEVKFPLVRGLTVDLKGLNDGSYTLRWFNPRTAVWLGQAKLEVKGGKATLKVPDIDKDIALKLEKNP